MRFNSMGFVSLKGATLSPGMGCHYPIPPDIVGARTLVYVLVSYIMQDSIPLFASLKFTASASHVVICGVC